VLTKNWRSGVGEYEVEQLYTAIKDKYYSICRVNFPVWMPPSEKAQYAAGIRKIMFQTDEVIKDDYVISIARNMPVIDPNPETIDRYRSTLDYAATALMVKDKYKPSYQFVSAFEGNHCFAIPANAANSFEYLITAGWNDGPEFRTVDSFRHYVEQLSLEYNNEPVLSGFEMEYKNGRPEPIQYWAPPREVPVDIPDKKH
jgi:hypothetical protein